MNNNLALFEEKEIRRNYQEGKWYFSVVDVVFALTGSKNPRRYWSDLKIKLSDEGYDIQFKRWLAKVGSERIEEIQNPELAMDRMKELYEKKGYSKSWINMRERGIATRHNLTDEWKERGISKGVEYAILTNEIYNSGFGVTAKEYKDIKGLHDSQNLRDSMTNIELALTNLGEATAVEFHKKNDSKGLKELKNDMSEAGTVINSAKKEIERKLERPIVTSDNYIELTEDNNLKLPN